MSPIEILKSKIGVRFGKNKTEELCRLAFEIGKRESLELNQVLEGALSHGENSFEKVTFGQLKKTLLKRRYPNFSEEDLKRVFLAPLNIDASGSRAVPQDFKFVPDEIYVEKKAASYPLVDRVRGAWPEVPIQMIDSLNDLRKPKSEWLKDFGKKRLAVSVENFDLVKPCPCTASTLSCNYYLLNIGYGCPFDCSYCYLQEYQNLPAIVLPVNVEDYLAQMGRSLDLNPKQFTRIGTGEYADSLALDFVTEYTKTLVPFFASKNVLLELKTKSDCVQNLIGLNHGGKTVIAWSVNPARFAKEEFNTAPIVKRLEAARLCERDGYGTAFHFDPIFDTQNWQSDYEELIGQIFSHVHKSIKWFSLGTLRYHRDLRRVAEFRHPQSEIFLHEERLDPMDDKMRYVTERRIEVYRKMVGWIKKIDSKIPIYLCMESPAVWKAVFEGKPYTGRIDEWISCGSSSKS